eukprot:gene16652-22089_t
MDGRDALIQARNMPNVTLNGVSIAFDDISPAGPADGPPVVLLHGFPYSVESFREVAPILAAKGCRVIVPYLRGVSRSGQQGAIGSDLLALMDALKMRRPILAGYDWGGRAACVAAALAKYDFLDAKRAVALGASYGGYMINWIAGNWSSPWKALVNHDGVFDNRSMAYSTEELWFDEWENLGTQYEKPANYEQFNPVNHVAKWTVPMLVVQGGKDYRIPVEQGIATFTALQRRGIPSQL